jgi:hypothetical protein
MTSSALTAATRGRASQLEGAPDPISRLDHVAELNADRDGSEAASDAYSIVSYPSAGEAVITRRSQSGCGRVWSGDGRSPSAPRRARSMLRRLNVSYRMTWLVTLTFGTPVFEYGCAREELRGFIRRLRRHCDGSLYWTAVIEAHESGAFHVHVTLRGVSARDVRAAWRSGRVDVRLLRSTDDRRAIANYMAKSFDSTPVRGRHRYERAEGMHVPATRCTAPDEPTAWRTAIEVMGGPPSSVSDSQSWRQWTGPKITVLQWDLLPGDENGRTDRSRRPDVAGLRHIRRRKPPQRHRRVSRREGTTPASSRSEIAVVERCNAEHPERGGAVCREPLSHGGPHSTVLRGRYLAWTAEGPTQDIHCSELIREIAQRTRRAMAAADEPRDGEAAPTQPSSD